MWKSLLSWRLSVQCTTSLALLAFAFTVPRPSIAADLSSDLDQATYGSEIALRFAIEEALTGDCVVIHLLRGDNVGPTRTAAGFLGIGGRIETIATFSATATNQSRHFEVPRLSGALAGKRIVLAFLTERQGVVTSASNSLIATFLEDRVLFEIPAFPRSFGFESRESTVEHTLHSVDFAGRLGIAVGTPPSSNGGNRNTALRTDDGGATWSPFELDRFRKVKLTNVELVDRLTGFIGGNYLGRGNVYSTDDAGATWSVRSFAHPVRGMSFFSTQRGYIVGNDGTFDDVLPISATRDGGATWIPQFQGASVDLWTVDAVTSQLAIAGGRVRADRAVLLKTSNAGNDWSLVDLESPNRRWILGTDHTFEVTPTLFAVGARGTIYRSENLGESFDLVPSGTGNDLRSIQFIDDQLGWITGDHGTLLATTNGGATWVPFDSASPQPMNNQIILDLVSITPTRAFAVGYEGMLLEFNRLED